MKGYEPETLFDHTGKLRADLAELAPEGNRRMGANPHTNGGVLLRNLRMPDFRDYAVDIESHGTTKAEATRILGQFPSRHHENELRKIKTSESWDPTKPPQTG